MNPKLFNSEIFLGLLSGALLGFAWLFPGEPTGALLGWLSALGFIAVVLEQEKPYWSLFWGGFVSQCVGFHWLIYTIGKFGGFNSLLSTLIFGLFAIISACQFPLFGYIAKIIERDTKGFALTTPLAWCTVEFLLFRIFPWNFGHSQLGFITFAQIADIGGSILVSFVLFWVCEVVIRMSVLEERSKHFAFPILLFLASLSYGRYRISEFSLPEGIEQKVAVIQANVSIEEKHDVSLIQANAQRYAELSKNIPGPDTLIIWPESVITEFIYGQVGSVGKDPRLPFFASNNPLLIGALTYETEKRFFNSAVAILNSGTVLDPYNKRILMPFGEFMPLASTFPFLAALNPNVANFTEGTQAKVFEYPMINLKGQSYSLRASPLICYEDTVSFPSRESVLQGAELLVNITNDGWFGDTIAPLQHNLIASFRSIENRRYLIRSTNTGLTAIINPLGQTVEKLAPFSEGTLLANIHLMSYMTLYTQVVGDILAWLIVILTLTFTVYHFAFRRV